MTHQNAKDPASVGALPGLVSLNPAEDIEMNSTTNSIEPKFSPEKIAECREWAAIAWTQWDKTDDPKAWVPPLERQWRDSYNPHMLGVHFAFASMFQSKEQTIAALEGLEQEGLIDGFMVMIEDAINFFKPLLEVLQEADRRFIIAGAAIVIRDLEEAA